MTKTQKVYRDLDDYIEQLKRTDIKLLWFDVKKEPQVYAVKNEKGEEERKTIYSCTLLLTASNDRERHIYTTMIHQAEIKSDEDMKAAEKIIEDKRGDIQAKLRKELPSMTKIEGVIE